MMEIFPISLQKFGTYGKSAREINIDEKNLAHTQKGKIKIVKPYYTCLA